MTKLENYLEDGANYQARATLMFLQRFADIEESWNKEDKIYEATIHVARWENCREQGYIVSLMNKKREQLNITFFEHRNSDALCSVKWLQKSRNSLNINTAEFGAVYKNKYDTSHEVTYGQAHEMAEWILKELTEHWTRASEN